MASSTIKRIEKNEKRLDDIKNSIYDLSKELDKFLLLKKDLIYLNKYYGSQEWFKDIERYNNQKLSIKAGVLSEDGVWNTLEDLNEMKNKLKEIIKIIDNLK